MSLRPFSTCISLVCRFRSFRCSSLMLGASSLKDRLVTSLSVFKDANILTLIIWVQLRHTQCMLVDKLLGKERARTIKSTLYLKVMYKYL